MHQEPSEGKEREHGKEHRRSRPYVLTGSLQRERQRDLRAFGLIATARLLRGGSGFLGGRCRGAGCPALALGAMTRLTLAHHLAQALARQQRASEERRRPLRWQWRCPRRVDRRRRSAVLGAS